MLICYSDYSGSLGLNKEPFEIGALTVKVMLLNVCLPPPFVQIVNETGYIPAFEVSIDNNWQPVEKSANFGQEGYVIPSAIGKVT